jgi:rhodanese-related sulfurtransferase
LEVDVLGYLLLAAVIFFAIRPLLPVKGVRQISAAQLKNELKDKNKQFVDVRTPEEFQLNHIQGFKNIPLQQLPQRMNELSKEKEVVVICQSGIRSRKASSLLKKHGFKVTNVKGGVSAWH